MGDGGGDSHRGSLALFQGARVAQADGLLQLPTLGGIVTALGPISPPLGSPRFHLQAATVVLKLFGGLLLRLTKPAQPAFSQ